MKWSGFKFEIDYKAYIEEDYVEEDTSIDLSEISLKLNDFSEKFDLKLDLIHSNQDKQNIKQKISQNEKNEIKN